MPTLAKRMEAVVKAFSAKKVFELRKMSNQMAEEAALNLDRELAEVSVVAYALHKLLSKEHVVKNPQWADARKGMLEDLRQAFGALEADNIPSFRKKIAHVSEHVTKLDRMLGNYMQKTFDKARVKQASRAYAAGISLMQAADLMGTSPKQLQHYIGWTKIHDERPSRISMRERLKPLKKLLE